MLATHSVTAVICVDLRALGRFFQYDGFMSCQPVLLSAANETNYPVMSFTT